MTDFEAVARSLAVEEPWSHSYEGLDDCCLFCGCWWSQYRDGQSVVGHLPGCDWLAARTALGLGVPERHVVCPDPVAYAP